MDYMEEAQKRIPINLLNTTIRLGMKRTGIKPRILKVKPDPESIITKNYDELKMPDRSVVRLCTKLGFMIMMSISQGIDYSWAIAKTFSISPNTIGKAIRRLENVAFLETKSVLTGNRIRKTCELTDMGLIVLGAAAKEAMDNDKHIMRDCFRIMDKFKKSEEWEKISSVSVQKVLR